MNNRIIIMLFLLFTFASCSVNVNRDEMAVSEELQNSNDVIYIDSAYKIKKRQISINDIADTLFYVKIKQKIDNVYRIDYCDNKFYINNRSYVYCFDFDGNLLSQIPADYASIDVNSTQKEISIYSFKNKTISIYDLFGNLKRTIKIRAKIEDSYGHTFAQVNDTIYAICCINYGYNEYEMTFINKNGLAVKRFPNVEQFSPTNQAKAYNSSWDKMLFQTSEGTLYHRYNSDTIFLIRNDLELKPIFIDERHKKIPLSNRLENVGGDPNELIQKCIANKWYHIKYYENKRFIIGEYVPGKSPTEISNYMLYDKSDKSLCIYEQDLLQYLHSNSLHVGIQNDYDGGLAFNPTSQSGDYLIMYNANGHGGAENIYKTLYKNGRNINGKIYKCKSELYISQTQNNILNHFLDSLNENTQSILTVIKLKSE